MMFLLNELSLHNQYRSETDFTTSLKVVLDCRKTLHMYQRTLHCSRAALGERQVIGQMPFRKIAGNLSDKNIKRAIFQWIDKDGPFWDDDQLHSPGEYYSDDKKGEVVTDTALAEAAFRMFEKMDSSVLSFSPSDYLFSPVIIKWHRDSSEVLDIKISNYWQIQLLSELLAKLQPPVQSWNQFIEYVKAHFQNLTFLPSFETQLKSQPFNHTIAKQAIYLLSIINEYKTCFDEAGRRTKRGDEIVDLYFKGDRSRFSDESDTDKIKFRRELTFKKPDGVDVFCTFHGKIGYRTKLHMSEPDGKDDPLYVAYLGEKITKK